MAVQWNLLDPNMAAKVGGSFQEGQRNALVMQQAGQEQQMNALKMQQTQREMENQNALSRAYQASGGDISKLKESLLAGGQFEPAMKVQKQITEQQTADLAAKKAELDDHVTKIGLVAQLLSSAHDQPSLDAAIQEASSVAGPEFVQNVPRVYNPTELQFSIKKGLSVKDQAYNASKEIDQQLRRQEISALGGYRQEQLGLGERELGLKEQEAERKAAETPASSALKASEDERKAAGWLSQADNAYKNMLKAMETKPGSEQPGWREATLGAVGLEGAKKAVQTPERQKFVQASKSLSEALLRAATGAGVNESEAKQKIEELTPSFLDDKETKQQKLDSIPVYLESLKTRAGRAAPEGYQPPREAPQGFKFLGFE
jgi:hypothetical protein